MVQLLKEPLRILKVVFFGSGEFAIEPLRHLLESSHQVVLVVGPVARARGRGLKAAFTPLVQFAKDSSLPLLQPEDLESEETLNFFSRLEFDAGVVADYGRLIPSQLFRIPHYGFVNLHPSLLPRYRGSAPIQRAIIDGADITGVTTILINERLDAGDILLSQEVEIGERDTAGTLRDLLSSRGARLLVKTLDGLENGEIKPLLQDEEMATYAPPITPQESNIDWSKPAGEIERLVRALNPKPIAYTFFRERRLKIYEVALTDVPSEGAPGTILDSSEAGLFVNCADDCLRIVSLQLEGKKRMSAREFFRGARIVLGERFTNS